ncbi:MAG: DUF1648 domain-containing protein [Dehalococcoidales bacterium]|nr:DUF1648 domain-containing protein [Dehalococcoidales bacterium]
MKNRLANPLWTHLPAFALLVAVIAYTIISLPLPAEVAIHFDFHGNPDNYGSPWTIFGLILGIMVIFIIVSFIIDEVWVRQEKTRKKFNWLGLMDELFGGLMVGVYIGQLQHIKSGDVIFSFPWGIIGIVAGAAVALGLILEFLRPFQPKPADIPFGDTKGIEQELEQRIKNDTAFIYWSSQNPLWVSVLSIVLPFIMVTGAVIIGFTVWWAGLILGLSGVMMVVMYGGLRVSVTKELITVKFGMLGSGILKLKTDEIDSLELKEFSPMADFGGYGIRFNGKVTAYYLRGSRGVLFTTTKGKQYLIGSDRPEELYAVAQAVRQGK